MTLKDLVSTNHRICEIDADIRDYSNGKALLIDSFNIGIRAYEDRALDENHEPRWKTIKKPINYKDIGKDYWGVIEKNIPKQLLDMEVYDWDLWHGWSTNNGLNKHMRLSVDLIGKDDCILIEPTEPQGQLEGQMCIEDLIGNGRS
jgi:hypothetical protein